MNQPSNNIKYEIKQSSQIMPAGPNPVKLDYRKIINSLIEYWSNVDTKYRQQFAKGAYMGTNSPAGADASADQVMDLIISCMFQCIRDDANDKYTDQDIEEKQKFLLKVSSTEDVFRAGVGCLKALNIKLDINLILSIILGSINETTARTTKQYENRYGTEH